MRLFTFAALMSALGGAAVADTPGSYFWAGNIVAQGALACSAINGTFPATINYFQNSTTGAFTEFFVNLTVYNFNLAPPLLPQNLRIVFDLADGTYTVFDPQLFGVGVHVAGTYTGVITPGASEFEFGTNFGQSNQTFVTLASGNCVIQISGLLAANPG